MTTEFDKPAFHNDLKERMQKAIHAMEKEFEKLRTGRANPSAIENVKAEYNGTPTPIAHMSTITIPDSKTIVIKPWDKSALTAIEKAIVHAGLGLTPTNMGDVLRISIPALTEERRKELAKTAKKMSEDAKIAVRNIRRDANDILKRKEKEKILSEDESKVIQGEVQKVTDSHIVLIESSLANKEKEITEV